MFWRFCISFRSSHHESGIQVISLFSKVKIETLFCAFGFVFCFGGVFLNADCFGY